MNWANKNFAPDAEAQPARLIIEVSNPADSSIASYFQKKGYETEDGKLDAGKTTYFLRLIVGIVLGVGLFISILSFYILMLSIFLLLQKNTTKGSAALSDTDRRTEHHRTDFICRIGMLAAQLLHREYQTPLPATGNRFVMGSCQYGYSFIPHRISH